MHDYLLSSEWIRFAFVFGVAVSMVMYEKRHITTGSIVVPGYIAVFLIHPLVIIATFLNAFVTYALVNKLLRRYFLLYGRTKFTLLAIISTTIQTVMLRLTPSGPWLWERDIPLFIGVGYIVPALIAHDMARQGVGKTTKAVLMAGGIVAIPIAIALLLDLPGVNDLAPIAGFGRLAITVSWLPLTVILSISASWAVAYNYGLRSGGFVGAALTGMFMADPWQVIAALVIAGITWLIVTKFLMNSMILFGRRKFSAMLLVSSSISWSGLWVGSRFLDASWEQHLGVGSLALTPLLLPGLLANDAQRTSPKSVLIGLTMAGTFAVTTTWWIQSQVIHEPLHPAWKIVSATSFTLLFAKQIAGLGLLTGSRALTIARSIPVPGRRTVQPAAPTFVLAPSFATGARAGQHADRQDDVAAWFTPWESWAGRHPDAARDAEAWLNSQMDRFGGNRRTTVGGAEIYADTSQSVLETALDAERGMRSIPRRLAPIASTSTSTTTSERVSRRLDEISETSDAATREAQLVASDVSDNTTSERSDVDPTTPIDRPLIDF